MKRIFIFLAFFLPFGLFAQVQDDFTDGDFTNNPTWTGETAKFIVNTSKAMQLSGLSANDTASIYTTNVLATNLEWAMKVKMGFAPSDNNLLRIYLISDQPNLEGSLNGYYLKIGENGTNDAIELYKQTGTTSTLLVRGTNGRVNGTTLNLGIKVVRNTAGAWQVMLDTLGGTAYVLEGTSTDNSITTTSYFGYWCKYTTTNKDKFSFDDIYVGLQRVDTTGPVFQQLNLLNATQLELTFDEEVDSATSLQRFNFLINNGVGNPATVGFGADRKTILLTLSNAIIPNQSYTVTVTGIQDKLGNTTPMFVAPFGVTLPSAYDVIFTEFMPDPDPAVGLPNLEYIEIYNRSGKVIDLKNWTLDDGGTPVVFPSGSSIGPGQYKILSTAINASTFSAFGSVLVLPTVPSLNNTGDKFNLKDQTGAVIHSVSYSDTWYRNTAKNNGGWSLEMIDTNQACLGDINWIASANLNGGTPGQPNSVFSTVNDTTAFVVSKVIVVDSMNVEVQFNKPISVSTANVTNFSVTGNLGVRFAVQSLDRPNVIQIRFTNPIQSGAVYTLSVLSAWSCVGNAFSGKRDFVVGIPKKPRPGDIVINEILFDPATGGSDFVELVNMTDSLIDLKDLQIANESAPGVLNTVYPITAEGYLLEPRGYVVLTENVAWTQRTYLCKNPSAFVQMSSLPTLYSDKGTVVLINKSVEVIDRVEYSDKQHFALLKDTKGVSLERIDLKGKSNDPTNWFSAASTVGYATPTYINSRYNAAGVSGGFSVSPKAISPNGDGVDDLMEIQYVVSGNGWTGTVRIFSREGFLEATPVRNMMLERSGIIRWNGLGDNGNALEPGIYVLMFEAFSTDGKQIKDKIDIVIYR